MSLEVHLVRLAEDIPPLCMMRSFSYFVVSECNIEEAMFFIVSPKDFVVAKLRDEDDHVTWLTEHEMFQVRIANIASLNLELPILPCSIWNYQYCLVQWRFSNIVQWAIANIVWFTENE